ncbi:hypothetical protein PXD04_07535 [Methanosphaera sp. ISO3-F5]|uniref:hypothetical protein n=1 Tax=Methanosphaera sp. ISO3-F5 TaxID=1452353 RepID=UPI002B2587BA|nr:hypothetical protein [Methanosphaera sp. ISO3-F5]WQH63548.1 hypothetical protein PXD04_07535 [Methanosphaera sp. ISO3-F5]
MADNKHPHKNVIDNYENIYPMVTLIDQSKTTYVRENLPIHLHASQIKLLKEANKHQKPHHKAVRINQYKKLKESGKEDKLFELHTELYIKKYEKLENKGLLTVNTDTDELPFDAILTEKGEEILNQINELEAQWEEVVLEGVEDKEKLLEQIKIVANNALPINYNHKKQQKFVF